MKPLEDTAAFEDSNECSSENKLFSQDSSYFTRNQIVIKDATYGNQININGKNILAEKLLQ